MTTPLRPNSLLNVNPGHPVVREHPLNRGMVGWWLALPHVVGGNTVYDLGGRHHGTLYSNTSYFPSWAGADRPGGANSIYINGNAQQNIALPTNLSGAFTSNEATFACWIKKIHNSGAYYAAGLAHLGPDSQVSAWGGAGYNCYFSIFEQLIRPIGPVVPSTIEQWTHVVVTTKPGTGNYRLILDGAVYATGDQSSFYLPSDPNFAGASASNQEAMAGWADDWRLWNRALSDDEVQRLYQESRAGYPTMLRRRPLYWSASGSTSYSFAPSGGIDLGGAAAPAATFGPIPSGGIDLGGSPSAPAVAFGPVPAGGVDLGGAAGTTVAYAQAPAGGLALGGSAGSVLAAAFAPAGGVALGGAAAVAGSTAYSFSPSGGVDLGGASPAAVGFGPPASGGVELGGAADVVGSTAYAYAPSGGVKLGGAAAIASAWILHPSGGVALGGEAVLAGAPQQYVVTPAGGVLFGGAIVDPTAAATLREAIVARLRATPGVTDLVGARIFLGSIPQTRPYPALTYFVPARTGGHNLDGADGVSRSRVQVSAWSTSAAEAVRLVEAVRDRFDGFRGWIGRVEVLGSLFQFETDLPEPPRSGDDAWVYQIAVDYTIVHRLPLPSQLSS